MKPADTAASTATQVQTSAQPKAAVPQQEPKKGGSYIRNTETGELVRAGQAPAKTAQE